MDSLQTPWTADILASIREKLNLNVREREISSSGMLIQKNEIQLGVNTPDLLA